MIEKLSKRGGELSDMRAGEDGTTRMEFKVPARGLIGYRSLFLSDTRGTGVLYHVFAEYGPHRGEIKRRDTGVMVALEQATSRAYALFNLQQRGTLMVGPGDDVYGGMIVGIAARAGDLTVNPGKGKKLTNVRASGSDDKLLLTPKKVMTLEDALEFIDDDELAEVTPTCIRLRKRYLNHSDRRRYEKKVKGM